MTTTPLPRPSFTLTDAAELVGVSRSTIRRRREKGAFPNAYKNHDAEWMIPLPDLLASGLKPLSSERVHERAQAEQGSSSSAPVTLTGLGHAAHEQVLTEQAHLQERLNLAEKELAVERARRESLEAHLADSKSHVNDLRKAMLMLEAGKKEEAIPLPGHVEKPKEGVGEFLDRMGQSAPAAEMKARKKPWWRV